MTKARVALVFEGNGDDQSAWSGTPFGLASGLRARDVEVEVVSAIPSEQIEKQLLAALSIRGWWSSNIWSERSARIGLHRAMAVEKQGVLYARMCSNIANTRIRRSGPFDAIIQIGASLEIHHPNVAVYGDMTAAQVIGRPFFGWDDVAPSMVSKRLALQRKIYLESTSNCLATPWAAASVTRDFGVPAGTVHAVGIGINQVIDAGPRDWSTPHFLFIGKDWIDKNGSAVVSAFTEVRREIPAARLDLVGNHPAVHLPGVEGHGFLSLSDPGQRQKVRDLYASATCLVVPTTFEPAGIVYLEAAAAGIPSIGSKNGGAPDIIGPGGLVVDPSSRAEIVEAMRKMTDQEYAEGLGEIAKRRAGNFTWEHVAGRILQSLGIESRSRDDWCLFEETGVGQIR